MTWGGAVIESMSQYWIRLIHLLSINTHTYIFIVYILHVNVYREVPALVVLLEEVEQHRGEDLRQPEEGPVVVVCDGGLVSS
jgi:hypothetical protein